MGDFMGKEKNILILVPAYNEEKNIGRLLESLESNEVRDFADYIIINDGSRDDTGRRIREMNGNMIEQVYNLGYGSALQTGYKYAVAQGYEYVIQMDADGQHDICNLGNIINKLTTKDENGLSPDIVIGSRFMEGCDKYHISFVKRLAIGVFRAIIRIATKKRITDPTSGLQGLSKRVFVFYSKYNHFDDHYPDANMLMQMILLGYRVEEIPAIMHQRIDGVSMHSGLKPIIYIIRMALSLMAVWVRVKILKIRN